MRDQYCGINQFLEVLLPAGLMLLSCPNSKHHPAKWYVIPSSHQFRFLIEVASQRPIEIYREKTQVTDAVSSYDYCYNIDARN